MASPVFRGTEKKFAIKNQAWRWGGEHLGESTL